MSSTLILVLHAHLPYVRQPSQKATIEELWFLEAVWETYLPLLDLLQKYDREHSDPLLALSISPPLAEMMRDPLMNEKFKAHMTSLEALARSEIRRTNGTEHQKTALMYMNKICSANNIYELCKGSILDAFRRLQDSGAVELLATAATHAFLPAYQGEPDAVRNQIRIGINYYGRMFGRSPKGFWLPECGYYEGLDQILFNEGIEYFFVEGHGLINSNPIPSYSIHKPVITPCGAKVFGRDMNACSQVWSSESGYPGADSYRDFYRDIGFDLPTDYISSFFHDFGARVFTGFKYYSVAQTEGKKVPYDRQKALQQAGAHAACFVSDRTKDFDELSKYCKSPVIVAAFDAELFGHWWFEGIEWLSHVIEMSSYEKINFKLNSPSVYLSEFSYSLQVTTPSASSWGEGGYNACWVNKGSGRYYRHLLRMPEMLKIFNEKSARPGLLKDAHDQALREMLLSESSDWFFLINKKRAGEYAEKRLIRHINNFDFIVKNALTGELSEKVLNEMEYDNPFIKDIGAMI